jgi:futalosine hydrolase
MPRLLVVTAASAEREAVLAGRSPAIGMVDGIEVHRAITPAGLLDVVSSGIGAVRAAVATSSALRNGYDLVISAGVAGGFPAAEIAGVVAASAVVHADLGAETADGFASMADLGWGPIRFDLDDALTAEVAHRTHAMVGAILTVSTVTGSQARADQLRTAHPDAVAEAMEGVGVYQAAVQVGVPFAEVRTVSNRVGPRDRDAWRITDALAALTRAFDAALASPLEFGAHL